MAKNKSTPIKRIILSLSMALIFFLKIKYGPHAPHAQNLSDVEIKNFPEIIKNEISKPLGVFVEYIEIQWKDNTSAKGAVLISDHGKRFAKTCSAGIDEAAKPWWECHSGMTMPTSP